MPRFGVLAALTAALVACAATAAHATVPGKNGSIVFNRKVAGHEQVFTMRSDGSHLKQLTHLQDSDASDPSWSPSGKQIAFARDYELGKPGEHLDIYTMNADGSGLHAMGLKGLNGGPTWMPDGKRILFLHAPGLWVIAATGGTPHLLGIRGDSTDPVVSPDGKSVVLVRYKGNSSALFVARLAGTSAKRITPWSLHAQPKLDWSPDGTRILFTNGNGVYTIQPDGAGMTTVLGKSDTCSDSFSPDGTQILFLEHCGSNEAKTRIATVNLDGSAAKPVPNTLHGHWASWGRSP
jgi:Tol biopolymer transport system component